jgi:hypothetical protein
LDIKDIIRIIPFRSVIIGVMWAILHRMLKHVNVSVQYCFSLLLSHSILYDKYMINIGMRAEEHARHKLPAAFLTLFWPFSKIPEEKTVEHLLSHLGLL